MIEELNNDGLKVGTLKSKIKTDEIINKIRLDKKEISWIGMEIKGTNAVINVVEAKNKPEMINDEDYCSIVAKKDAQVVKISARNGSAVVNEGDIVTKGDTLIAGWMEGAYTGTRYVHASGEVKAKVWYKEKEKIPLMQTKTERTGNEETRYKIKFNNFQINLYKTLSNFKKYDTIENEKNIKIFSDFYLPIVIKKIVNYEITETQITYGIEEAKQIGEDILSTRIESYIENPDNILQKYVNSYANEDYIEVEVIYEVLENIGVEEKIVF